MNKDIYEIFVEKTDLFYKKTDGGAEYLCEKPIENTIVGDLNTAIIRLDGGAKLIGKEQ